MEILAYTIPSLVVLACAWLIMHKLFKNEEQKRLWELKKLAQKEISPVRLRAYERLTLLLERTQPEHLLMDLDLASMTVEALQQHLLRTIRMEFDHNMSQQIYVSDETWDKIMQARDQMATFVIAAANQMPKETNALEYAQMMMKAYRSNGATPHEAAMEALKEEVRQIL